MVEPLHHKMRWLPPDYRKWKLISKKEVAHGSLHVGIFISAGLACVAKQQVLMSKETKQQVSTPVVSQLMSASASRKLQIPSMRINKT